MKLAVLLPHRDREAYKEFQKEYLTKYLFNRGIEHKVFLCEQKNDKLFNRSKSINVAFTLALEDYRPDYIVVSDIDFVPLNVDYAWKNFAEVWFGNAGGVKVLASDFILVNGFNNTFAGWGYEDSEFWDRLDTFSIHPQEWKTYAHTAEMVDLEMTSSDSLEHSVSYFGYSGPRFYKPSEREETKHIDIVYKKSWLTPEGRENNAKLCDSIKTMARDEKVQYFKNNGLNQLSINDVCIESDSATVAEVYWQ